MPRKYELVTDQVQEFIGDKRYKLYRIRALRDFGIVKAGDFGGYIESEANLSHDGDAWISGNARVYDDALVCDNAFVFGGASISGRVIICGSSVIENDEIDGEVVVGLRIDKLAQTPCPPSPAP
jgi:hypothetical protein